MKKINLKKIILFVYIFVFIYQPVIPKLGDMSGVILLTIFTFLYLLKNVIKRNKNFLKQINKKAIILYIFFIILSTSYFTCRTILAGTSIKDFSSIRIIQGLMPIFYLIGALIINNEMNELNYDFSSKIKMILNVGIFQGVIALTMFVFPNFKNVALNIYMSMGAKENYFVTTYRIYGICNGDYTYALQILHGILAFMSIAYAYYYKKKKYYFYSMIIFSVTLLNGRFGILIFGILLLCFLISIAFENKKTIFNNLKIVLGIFAMLLLIYLIIIKFMPNVKFIVEHAISDVINYSEGEDKTETGRLVESFYLPKNIVFGDGYRIYGGRGKKYGENRWSDSGFTNDLFMGGLIYAFLLYYPVFMLIKKILIQSKKHTFHHKFTILFSIGIILANVKGEVFRSIILQTFMILILAILLMNSDKEGIKNE